MEMFRFIGRPGFEGDSWVPRGRTITNIRNGRKAV